MTILPRRTRRTLPALAALLVFTFSASTVIAQNPAPSATWSQEDTLRIITAVQKKVGGLTDLGVFDWLTFGIHGKTIVLKGYASRPSLKSDATNAVKGIDGVASVDNQIEVLPVSMNDDRIRVDVYNRIYTQAALRKYNANQGTIGQATSPGGRAGAGRPSVSMMAGGVTNDPPRGFHAIHIVVKNGNVTLYGVVNNSGDSAIAEMQVNSAPGVFSVDNDLVVPGTPAKAPAK
jgi:hyperosmotically inducible protein